MPQVDTLQTGGKEDIKVGLPPNGNLPIQQRQALPEVSEYGNDALEGQQKVTVDERQIPFWRIIQSNSPQVNPTESKYLDYAKPGMIMNTSTLEVIDGLRGGMQFIPVWRHHDFVEYVPRDKGGGWEATWPKDDPRIPSLRQAQGQFGKLTLENGNELIEVFYFQGLGISPEGFCEEGVIGFASTQIKKYKMMTARLENLVGRPTPKYPQFAFRWLMGTVAERNKKGAFFGWKPVLDGDSPDDARMSPKDPLYQRAREFFMLCKTGKITADYSATTTEEDPTSVGDDDEIPMN